MVKEGVHDPVSSVMSAMSLCLGGSTVMSLGSSRCVQYFVMCLCLGGSTVMCLCSRWIRYILSCACAGVAVDVCSMYCLPCAYAWVALNLSSTLSAMGLYLCGTRCVLYFVCHVAVDRCSVLSAACLLGVCTVAMCSSLLATCLWLGGSTVDGCIMYSVDHVAWWQYCRWVHHVFCRSCGWVAVL